VPELKECTKNLHSAATDSHRPNSNGNGHGSGNENGHGSEHENGHPRVAVVVIGSRAGAPPVECLADYFCA
jgi:hypothetical protein